MSHNPKEANKEMEKAIFISADCWLEVFDLLPPSQLGFGIALISHRFDYFVDEHFKTRKWKLGRIVIRHKIGENGAKEMEIVNNFGGKALPIPQIPLPKKVIGFKSIEIEFIDQNVITFLGHFHRFFAACSTTLFIDTENVRVSEFVMRTIWPMFKDTTIRMYLNSIAFHRMRQLVPSMLNDCQSLQFVSFDGAISFEFPPDDSANASDGQAVAKWLFTPRTDNLMNNLTIYIENSAMEQQWSATVEQIKAAFSSASSPVSFDISIDFSLPSSLSSVVPFELTNEFTGEKLELLEEEEEEYFEDEEVYCSLFSLSRCPIGSDDKKQQQMIKELDELYDRWNRIDIDIADGGVDDGLLDAASAGPSDG